MAEEKTLAAGNGLTVKANEVTVTLGERTYTITPLTLGKSQAWRQKFNAPVTVLVEALEKAPDTDITDFAALGKLVTTLQGTLLGSMDLVFDLLCEYSPAIQADREYILETAIDEQVISAFIEVLKLAYPFGRLAGLILPSRG